MKMKQTLVFVALLVAVAFAAVEEIVKNDQPCEAWIADPDNFTVWNYNLSVLHHRTGKMDTLVFNDDNFAYAVNLCGQAELCRGHGASSFAVCQKTNGGSLFGLGNEYTQVFTESPDSPPGQGVMVTYTDGDKCSSGLPRTTVIYVNCDPDVQTGYIYYAKEVFPCHYLIKIWSKAGCGRPEYPHHSSHPGPESDESGSGVEPPRNLVAFAINSWGLVGIDSTWQVSYLSWASDAVSVATNETHVVWATRWALNFAEKWNPGYVKYIYSLYSTPSQLGSWGRYVFFVVRNTNTLYRYNSWNGQSDSRFLPAGTNRSFISGDAMSDEEYAFIAPEFTQRNIAAFNIRTGQTRKFALPWACEGPSALSVSRTQKATVWCRNAVYSGDLTNMEPTAIRWMYWNNMDVSAVTRLDSNRGVFVASNSSLFYGSMSYEYLSPIIWQNFADVAAF